MSKIEWTDVTWNPVTGCDKISPGCKHCYAESLAKRCRAMGSEKYKNAFALTIHPKVLGDPLKWKKPRMCFVCSMSDLFHRDVPNEYIASVFGVMAACARHTFQLLTKRAERLPEFMEWVQKRGRDGAVIFNEDSQAWRIWQMLSVAGWRAGVRMPAHDGGSWPLPNVWLGVSVEDRKHGLPRIEHLRRTPAAVRFLSIEPLLEDLGDDWSLTGIDWVIVGGESGHGARPMHPDWVRRIRDKVRAAGTECRQCYGAGYLLADGGVIYPGSNSLNRFPCPACHRRGWTGPTALFVKQDSGLRSGRQGDLPDDLWAYKEFPNAKR